MKKVFIMLMGLLAMLATSLSAKAQEITITLNPGWNWISYPNATAMEIGEALGDFVPMEGDMLKSQAGYSSYSSGSWSGSFSQFTPGWGYMYYSARTQTTEIALSQASSSNVTTATPTNINATSAMSGGTVTVPEGGHVFLCGVCYGTEPNPDIDGSHTSLYEGTGTTFMSALDDLTPNTTYYVRAYAVSDYGLAYGNEVSFTTLEDSGGGHDYVDLGLPSGLLWATCNVGASKPEEYGGYYAWGETETKDNYKWSTYQYCNGDYNKLTKYCTQSGFGYNGFTDNLSTLLPEDDAATANWGNGWRMPTQAEWEELYSNTAWSWTTQNGVNGRLFTASNGNSIFLPAAGSRDGNGLYSDGSSGFYWSRSLRSDHPCNARRYRFTSSANYVNDDQNRRVGHSVRAVRSSGQN